MKNRKIFVSLAMVVAMTVVAAAASLFLSRGIWLRAAGEWLVVKTPLRKADVIYVYAGGPLERPQQAAELYRRGFAPRVAVAGILIDPDLMVLGHMFNDGTVNRLALMRRGVPGNAVVQIWQGTSTMEETRGLRALMDAQGWKTAILVSSPIHMRRIRFTVSRAFKGAGYKLYYAPVEDPRIRPDSWWLDEEGLISVTVEYIKLVYYHVEY